MRTILISAAVVIAFILAANEGPNFAPNAIGMGMIGGLVWLSRRGEFRVSDKSKDPELQTPKKALRKLAKENPGMRKEIEKYVNAL